MESWYPAKEEDVSGQCPACSHLPALELTVQVSRSFPSQTGHCHASASLPPPTTTKSLAQAKGACLVAYQEHGTVDSSIQLYLYLKLQSNGLFCQPKPL